MSATMKNELVGYLTMDEMVSIRVALNNSINTVKRLINQEKTLSSYYSKELESLQEAKSILANSLNRDN